MSNIEVAAVVVVGLWLSLLTIVLLIVIRQLGFLMTGPDARADVKFDISNDGLEIGSATPEEVMQAVPEARSGSVALVLLSAHCTPCRTIASSLDQQLLNGHTVVALVPGRAELADSLIEMLPIEVRTIRDPEAVNLAGKMEVRSAPFAFKLEQGEVAGKAYLHEVGDLMRLMSPPSKDLVARFATGSAVDTRKVVEDDS